MNDLPLVLDRGTDIPLHRQLYRALRTAILDGRLREGTRLPAGRALAAQLGISRATVTEAYEQLVAEGYVEARQGAGTFVAALGMESQPFHDRARTPVPEPDRMESSPLAAPRFDFRYGSPDVAELPLATWRRLLARQWKVPSPALLAYGDAAGWLPLREALAAYLARARAVRAEAGRLIVTTGSQQALDLVARAVLRPGDPVAIEEPGYRGAWRAFAATGATLIPIEVDGSGLDPGQVEALEPPPRLVYVTPSHQFPTGAVMPLARRTALLRWAERVGALIVEDDYDSEFRFRGAPISALQGLDDAGRVFYVGTFSKSLFPALRLGYLVTPPAWREALVGLKETADRQSPALEQAAMAGFVGEGHFERHVRRLRRHYGTRRETLLAALARHGLAPAGLEPAGLHVLLPLPAGCSESAVVRAAAGRGVALTPGAPYSMRPDPPPRLLLGYTAVRDAQIEPGIARLAECIRATL